LSAGDNSSINGDNSVGLSEKDGDDTFNRIALLTLTTAMATFSLYLVSLIVFVLKSSCVFCYVSAALSVTLAAIAWFGGAGSFTPSQVDKTRTAILSTSASVAVVTFAALGLYSVSAPADAYDKTYGEYAAFRESASSSLTMAASLPSIPSKSTNTKQGQSPIIDEGLSPPPISATSSVRALQLSADLKALNTRYFGAYWCSHCYEQKETLGKEAMANIPYIECAKDGYRSQNALCKENKIPGYPTWQISGKLFPGEQSLEELEEIVQGLQRKN
jgi:hypothetical protein